ncbi:DNRLRE domain-containing protein [Candidatus Thorarchaeota archaeon]|nr:MAG: DNRLRE domain-containing protein [Candidatus Thorarchaeota archaeon]
MFFCVVSLYFGDREMDKTRVFLIIFIMLLGLVIVPTGPTVTTDEVEMNVRMNEAAAATSGTLKIIVSEDVGVLNGSYADTNFGTAGELYLGTGDEGTWATARSWFKFNLTHLPRELSVKKATMNVYCAEEWSGAGGTDEPIGVYYSEDDSWGDMTLTWNTQPTYDSEPTDVIDSPESPYMFEEFNWYSWDVTTDVKRTLLDDKILTEILKQVTEWGSQNAFWYPFDSSVNDWYAAYIEIEYTAPTTASLTVDGITSGILLDYIRSENPELGWTFSDPDPSDYQRDYDVEVWNNQYYNDSLLWKNTHESVYTIHNSFGDSPNGNVHPFGLREEFRIQMKYPSASIPSSGIVDKLYFTSSDDSGTLRCDDLEISMIMVESSTGLTTNLEANLDGRTPTIVFSRNLFEIEVINGIIEIDIENTFMVNKDLDLIVQIRLMNNTGNLFHLNRTLSGGPGSTATAWGIGAYTASIADYASTRTYDLKIGYLTKQVFSGVLGFDNGFPFDTTVGHPGRFQIKYNQSYIDRAGFLDRAFMRVDLIDENVVFENFKVTVVESPVLGPISNGTWTDNYGGATPRVVIDAENYTLRNLGGCVVMDFTNTFYYSNNHDLLIDIQWDSLISGGLRVLYGSPATSSYRAWDLHYAGLDREGSGAAGYDLMLGFVNGENSIPLEGCISLVNATRYYWRARTCDSLGIWSDWTTKSFKYEVRNAIPSYSTPIVSPEPVRVGEEVTVSLNVTYAIGVYQVMIDFNGTAYPMIVDGDAYSFTWSPAIAEPLNFTISMQSNANTWAYVNGSLIVLPALSGFDTTTLLIIGGVIAVVVVIVIVVLLKRRPAK